jgi:transcriptional regulator with XRE-family HTH domain
VRIDGTMIRQARTRRLWTQAELAAKAGVDERTVQRLERTGQTSFATLQAMAETFGIDVATLVDSAPASPLSRARWTATQTSPRRQLGFKFLFALAMLSTMRVGMFDFGDSGNWPHWQIFFLASIAAIALLIYGYRTRDLRAFGTVTLAADASLLWYLPLALPAAVFLTATYLVLAIRPRGPSHGAAPPPMAGR